MQFFSHDLRETERAMLLVLFQDRVVWPSAQHFGEFPAFGAAQQIHLPKAIAGGHIALGEIQIFVILRFDVGNAAFVASDGYAIAQACQR